MPDYSAEVRAAAVEAVARVFYEADAGDELATTGVSWPSWDRLDKSDAHRAIADARLAVDALAAAGQLRGEPVAYVVYSSIAFTTPPPPRGVHLRLTRAEADTVLEMLEFQAASNPQWARGVEYLIGGIHPVPRSVSDAAEAVSPARPEAIS